MSELPDIEEGAGDAPVEASSGLAALGIALHAAKDDASIAAEARAYLSAQKRYLELQMEDLDEQRHLTLSHLRWRRFGDQVRGARHVAVILLIAAIFVAVAVLLWNASQARGLLVQPLKTPADIAAKGRDGTVLAQQVIDDLNRMVAASDVWSFRTADSIAGNWGDDSKVEIPETSISFTDLNRSLRAWLGNETHISGEVFHNGDRITVQLRVSGAAPASATGAEADLDKLAARAAERVFAQTQSYRYHIYLIQLRRFQEAAAIGRQLALTASPEERPWGYSAWASGLFWSGEYRAAELRARQGLAIVPCSLTFTQ